MYVCMDTYSSYIHAYIHTDRQTDRHIYVHFCIYKTLLGLYLELALSPSP